MRWSIRTRNGELERDQHRILARNRWLIFLHSARTDPCSQHRACFSSSSFNRTAFSSAAKLWVFPRKYPLSYRYDVSINALIHTRIQLPRASSSNEQKREIFPNYRKNGNRIWQFHCHGDGKPSCVTTNRWTHGSFPARLLSSSTG